MAFILPLLFRAPAWRADDLESGPTRRPAKLRVGTSQQGNLRCPESRGRIEPSAQPVVESDHERRRFLVVDVPQGCDDRRHARDEKSPCQAGDAFVVPDGATRRAARAQYREAGLPQV